VSKLLAVLFNFCLVLGAVAFSFSAKASVLYNASANEAIGSATPFCWSLQQDRFYFITAYHVTKNVPNLSVGKIYDLDPVQAWPALDLALYSTKPNQLFVIVPCQEFSLKLKIRKISKLSELRSQPPSMIALHGYDAQTKSNSSKTVVNRVALIDVGRAGYAKIPLMVIDTPSGPGLSGGLVSADVSTDGEIASHAFGPWPAAMRAGYANEAIGIIIGRSKDGQRTYAISAIQFRMLTGQFPGFDELRTEADVARIKALVEDLKNLSRTGGIPEEILDSGTGRLVE
jgi:hypothetical protein